MELSRIEYRRLVEDVAEAVLAKVLPFVKKRRAEKPEEQWTWVSAEEAAKIVGLTKNYLLRQKAYFTHVKIGKSKACRVMFRKETLFEEHMRSQTERRRIPPARKNEAPPRGLEIEFSRVERCGGWVSSSTGSFFLTTPSRKINKS